jgi:uncharacterized protein YigE (DUF2233 family)
MISAVFLVGLIAAVVVLYEAMQPEPVPEPPELRSPPSVESVADTSAYVSFVLRAGTVPIRMYWRDENARALRTLDRVRRYEESRGNRLRFAMNGGMYQKDRTPVGLFIHHGRVLSPLDTSSGWGNFYLKPNGVFLVRKDSTVAIVTTERFEYTSDIEFATQSGPMLVIDGAIHPVFEQGSSHLNIRNGVGVRDDGTVIFAISRDKVTLYDFASYFKALNCRNALYLDGFVSRCYLPEKGWTQLDGDFGVMIGVAE